MFVLCWLLPCERHRLCLEQRSFATRGGGRRPSRDVAEPDVTCVAAAALTPRGDIAL
jgi:hypothetical protein